MGIANLEPVGTTKRVCFSSFVSYGDIHGFHSIELQRKYRLFEQALRLYRDDRMAVDDPADDSDVDMFSADDDMDNDLPLRAEPELVIDFPTEESEKLIQDFVTEAVREVGWVPRDVYHYLQNPTSFSMFCTLSMAIATNEFL